MINIYNKVFELSEKHKKGELLCEKGNKEMVYMYEYDKDNKLIHVKNPSGCITTYDEEGRVVHEIYPDGYEVFIEYKEFDKIIHSIYPNRYESWTTYRDGNLINREIHIIK